MLFNSFDFFVFLPVVWLSYWLLAAHLRPQNLLLLIASYVFYGWWDWRFLFLIALSSVVDFSIGLAMPRATPSARRSLLAASLTVNLGLLGSFKYFNFFAENTARVFGQLGLEASWTTLHIVLPVGISFYTFQTLSYTIDVYRGRIEPTRDAIAFLAYVSFFPQLVAGPIERATSLLPQFLQTRKLDDEQAIDGMRQMLWGFFKKVVVADRCGVLADEIFGGYADASSATLALGAFFFAMQIYGDFSGYSDIAIGTGRLFGFRLMRNFAYPYFSRDISEFWRRWHISLSTWFRDYVYIPLGGSRVGTGRAVRNIFIVFLVSGFWHGANWTFLAWGGLNAIYFVPMFLRGTNRDNLDVVAADAAVPSLRELAGIFGTFSLTLVAWVFFRAPSVAVAIDYLGEIGTGPFLWPLRISGTAMVSVAVMIAVEWVQRSREHGLELSHVSRSIRYLCYLVVITAVVQSVGAQREFIYFQF